MYAQPRYLPAGDQALVVELGDSIDPAINRKVRNLLLAIEGQNFNGIRDLMPSYRSLLVYYDPSVISIDQLTEYLKSLQSSSLDMTASEPKLLHIPSFYGGDMGPDLDFVAQHNSLTPQEVVAIHSGIDYLVYMLGFSPGFPLLGGMSERISTPRLESPRTVIPAGSVGLAEKQTGVYPTETPGGWRLIGRTPLKFFHQDEVPPTLVEPGDYIRFVPIGQGEYERVQRKVEEGTYQVVVELVD